MEMLPLKIKQGNTMYKRIRDYLIAILNNI